MKAYYATRAPYYDDVYEQPERREDIARLRQLLANRFAGRQVVEVACGTGYWSQHIAPAAAGLVATDALAEPLEMARQRPACAAVRFRQVDAYALPPDLGRFNAAFAGLWLSHVPVRRRRTFFASLHRVLQPGGVLAISSLMFFPIHAHPWDYWRFTPEGFDLLLRPFESRYVTAQGWELMPEGVFGIGVKGPAELGPAQLPRTTHIAEHWAEGTRVDFGPIRLSARQMWGHTLRATGSALADRVRRRR